MAGSNYVGSITVNAGATVGLFATTGVTAIAAVVTIFESPGAGMLAQVNSSAGTGTAVGAAGTFQVGSAEVYIHNPTSSNITAAVRIASLT